MNLFKKNKEKSKDLNDLLFEYIENIEKIKLPMKRCDIRAIEELNNKFYVDSGLDKSQLVNKIIKFIGASFEALKTTTVVAYNDVFQKVIKLSSELYDEVQDPMFLVGYLTIITEWHLHQSLDIKEYKEPERNKEA